MKDIMAKESSSSKHGVPTFAYNPADKRFPVLFEYGRPLDDLQGMLKADFAGTTRTVREIFEQHHIGKPYVLKNYKDIIAETESNSLVTTTRSGSNRKRNQCPDHVQVTFTR